MPWATLICKGEGLHRHPVSMNLLLACVRTEYWLQWEDDWELPRSIDMLSQARQVMRESKVHQLALNGAWQLQDSAWGAFQPHEHLRERTTLGGSTYLELLYPESHRQRCKTEPLDSLIDGYLAGVQPSIDRAKRLKVLLGRSTAISRRSTIRPSFDRLATLTRAQIQSFGLVLEV